MNTQTTGALGVRFGIILVSMNLAWQSFVWVTGLNRYEPALMLFFAFPPIAIALALKASRSSSFVQNLVTAAACCPRHHRPDEDAARHGGNRSRGGATAFPNGAADASQVRAQRHHLYGHVQCGFGSGACGAVQHRASPARWLGVRPAAAPPWALPAAARAGSRASRRRRCRRRSPAGTGAGMP